MAAGPETVAGSNVGGSTSLGASGTEPQNGLVMTLADDVASINAARANMYPIDKGRIGADWEWSQIYQNKVGGY